MDEVPYEDGFEELHGAPVEKNEEKNKDEFNRALMASVNSLRFPNWIPTTPRGPNAFVLGRLYLLA